MTEQEQAWWDRARQGDSQALVALLEARRPQLVAYIQRRLDDSLRRKIDAADVFQEVSLRAVESLGKVYLDSGDPFPWFCYLADKKIIDARRYYGAQKRNAQKELTPAIQGGSSQPGDLFQMIAASVTSPSGAFSRQARETKLAAAIEGLSNEQQAILKMRFVDGLSSNQIAENTGKSDGAVRTLLSRVLKRLQQSLGEDDDFESCAEVPESDGS